MRLWPRKNPIRGITVIDLGPDDLLLAQTDHVLSQDQAQNLKSSIEKWLSGEGSPVAVTPTRMDITVIRRSAQ